MTGRRRSLFATGILAGTAAIVGAFLVATRATAGGGQTLEGWWLGECGVALLIATFGLYPGWGRATGWTGLFVLGGAAQLGLMQPHWLQFIDLRPASLAVGTRPLSVAVLALQAIVVGVSLRGRHGAIRRSLVQLCTGRFVIGAGLLFLLSFAHVSPFVGRAASGNAVVSLLVLMVAAVGLFVLNLAHLWIIGLAIPEKPVLRAWHRISQVISLPGLERQSPSRADRRFPWCLAAVVLCASASIAWFVFDGVPHIPDGIAYVFHSRCFASGILAAPRPPVHEAFSLYLIDSDGPLWFTTMNPGWPAVLSLGTLCGVPWLVNPVLAALCVPLFHRLVRRILGCGWAHLGALLMALSPWFLFLAASHMTHILVLFVVLAAWVLVQGAGSRRSVIPSLAAGALLGLAVSVRTLDALTIGVMTGLWLLFGARAPLRAVCAYALGCLAAGAGWLAYNWHFTGSPLRTPLNVYFDSIWYAGANRLGFGADVGNPPGGWGSLDPLPGHGLADVVLNLNQNLYNLNFELHGFAVGSLAFLAAHLFLGRISRADRWLLVPLLGIPLAYGAYWFSGGPDFGPRYWFPVLVPCVWFTIRGIQTLMGRAAGTVRVSLRGPQLGSALASLLIVSTLTFIPWRATAKYAGYRGYHADFVRMCADGRLGNALVLVRTDSVTDWGSAFVLNRPVPDLQHPVFARDLDDETTARLIRAFPGRPVIHVSGRAVTGGVARLVSSSPPR